MPGFFRSLTLLCRAGVWLTNVDMDSLALMSEAGFIQVNAIGLQDLSGLSPSQQSQFIYGPILPATTLNTPSEDLYDEGAGAVWGSLSDEGSPPSNSPGGAVDGTGAGHYGPGVTADTGYDATGALDSGFDDMGGVFGYGDTGPGDTGPGDTGPGDTGPGGGDGPTVGIEVPDAQAWEGPYHVSKLDEAKFVLNVTGGNYLAANFSVTMNRFQEVSITVSDTHRRGSEYGTTFENSYAGGASGDLQMWSVPSNCASGLKPWSLETGGHMITSGRLYTVGELSLAVNENRATAGIVVQRQIKCAGQE